MSKWNFSDGLNRQIEETMGILDALKRRPKMLIQAKIPAELYDQLVRLSEECKTTKSALVLCGLELLVAEIERQGKSSKRSK